MDRGELAAALAEASAAGRVVRVRGGGTKVGWGGEVSTDVELSTSGLDRVVEHNAGDLTAVIEGGVSLARAQALFREAGQMLAIDPPAGGGPDCGRGAAGIQPTPTIGGVLATANSGPLRHRYGAPRDLVVGMTVALSDGTIARSGGKVIKNVAGYDLAKLFTGSLGTLGVILEAAVRLHPRPPRTATVRFEAPTPEALATHAAHLAAAPLELEALDVRWAPGTGGAVLAQLGGAAAPERAAHLDGEIVDDAVWDEQRAAQRSSEGTVARVTGPPAILVDAVHASERTGAHLVGRAAHGTHWLRIEDRSADEQAAAVHDIRTTVPHAVVLDAPGDVRAQLDPWGPADPGVLALMRRVKQRFDPAGTCNRGAYVGGI